MYSNHFKMYSAIISLSLLISSPSFGAASDKEILSQHYSNFELSTYLEGNGVTPDDLRKEISKLIQIEANRDCALKNGKADIIREVSLYENIYKPNFGDGEPALGIRSQMGVEYKCKTAEVGQEEPESDELRSGSYDVRNSIRDSLQEHLIFRAGRGTGCGKFYIWKFTPLSCIERKECKILMELKTDNVCEAATTSTVKFDLRHLEKWFKVRTGWWTSFNFVNSKGQVVTTFSRGKASIPKD